MHIHGGNSERRSSNEEAADHGASYDLTLYVSGATELSARAIANVSEWCESHLPARHRLAFVDVSDQPDLASTDRILVTPTLVKTGPAPSRRVIGDLSSPETVLRALGIPSGVSASNEEVDR